MHRDGSGRKYPDIEGVRAVWRADGRTVSTYPNKGEFDAWVEDLGELTHTDQHGNQLRRHATIKAHARGGSPKIVHNCCIVGKPGGAPPYWTYYHDHEYTQLAANRTPVS